MGQEALIEGQVRETVVCSFAGLVMRIWDLFEGISSRTCSFGHTGIL